MGEKALWIHVCVWDPSHTLARVQKQQDALADGTIAKLIKKHGKGTEALRAAMQKAKLVTMSRDLRGQLICPECGALMDKVVAREGVVNKLEAVRDIAHDFEAAIDRSRLAKL